MKNAISTIQFDFEKFIVNERTSISEIAKKTYTSYVGIWQMIKRGSLKPTFLRKLEESYKKDLSAYIIKEQSKKVA